MSKVANIIVGDIETGGLTPTIVEKDQVKYFNPITEIALICIDGKTLEEIDRYEAVIAPYRAKGTEPRYEKAALEYSGMTMSKIEGGKDSKEVANELEAYFKKHDTKMRFGAGKPILCGHNFLKFDKVFINYFMWLHGKIKLVQKILDDKNMVVEFDESLYQQETFDTLNWARIKYAQEDLANNKLGTCCEFEEIPMMDAHRAMNDAEGNAALLIKYLKSLRNGGEGTKKEKRLRDTFRF